MSESLLAPPIADIPRAVLDALPLSVVVYKVVSRTEFPLEYINLLGAGSPEKQASLIGKSIGELVPPEEAAKVTRYYQRCLDTGAPVSVEDSYQLGTGVMWSQARYIPLRCADRQISHIMIMWEDTTERKLREQEERERQEAIIQHQAAALAELSTPLLMISGSTVVLPLIGAIDSRRAQQILETLLAGVAERRASNVILDITGVPVVDTQVANVFLQASQAVALLGARTIVTGIRPEVAQTLVGLGVDLQDIVTRSTLQEAITFALQR
jgi:rsbT co-antagonist protein RsbR